MIQPKTPGQVAAQAAERALAPASRLLRIGQTILMVLVSLVCAPIPLLLLLAEQYPEVEGAPSIPPVLAILTVLGSAAVFWGLVLMGRRWRRLRRERWVKTVVDAAMDARGQPPAAPPSAIEPPRRPAGPGTQEVLEDAAGFRAWVGQRLTALGWRVELLAEATGGPAYVIEGKVDGAAMALPIWVRAEDRSITSPDLSGWALIANRTGVPVAVIATLDGIDSRSLGQAEDLGVVVVEPDELPFLADMITEGLARRRST
ncbi:MAG: hypothetical protein AAGC57_01200 [Pseudomonadota bacterium]